MCGELDLESVAGKFGRMSRMLYENERTYKKWRSLFYLAVENWIPLRWKSQKHHRINTLEFRTQIQVKNDLFMTQILIDMMFLSQL